MIQVGTVQVILIHTPLAGVTSLWMIVLRRIRDFNPHSPCGE